MSEGRWITLGAKGTDGKRHGSPVYIEDGRITKGSPQLTGKRIDALDEKAEGGSVRTANKQEAEYGRASWAKKARGEGLDPQHLHQLAADLIAHDKANTVDLRDMLTDVVSANPWVRGVIVNARHGIDQHSVKSPAGKPGLDQISQELAHNPRYGHLFAGDHGDVTEDNSGRLFDYLIAGQPKAMPEADAYEQAFDHLMGHKKTPTFGSREWHIASIQESANKIKNKAKREQFIANETAKLGSVPKETEGVNKDDLMSQYFDNKPANREFVRKDRQHLDSIGVSPDVGKAVSNSLANVSEDVSRPTMMHDLFADAIKSNSSITKDQFRAAILQAAEDGRISVAPWTGSIRRLEDAGGDPELMMPLGDAAYLVTRHAGEVDDMTPFAMPGAPQTPAIPKVSLAAPREWPMPRPKADLSKPFVFPKELSAKEMAGSIHKIQFPNPYDVPAMRTGINAGVSRTLSEHATNGLVSNNESQIHKKHLDFLIDNMADGAVSHLHNNVQGVSFHKSPMQLAAWVKDNGIAPKDFPHGVNGIYDQWHQHLHLTPKETMNTHAHEIGHALDGPGFHGDVLQPMYSREPQWKQIYNTEIHPSGLADIAKISPQEGWAEFGRLALTEPYFAKKMFPQAYAFWQQKGLVR